MNLRKTLSTAALGAAALTLTGCDQHGCFWQDDDGVAHPVVVVSEQELPYGIGDVLPGERLDIIMDRSTPTFGRTPQERCDDFGGHINIHRGVQIVCAGVDF